MIFTFYSYKGGVGRSMALANLAVFFRRQDLQVLIVDWDLEGPGLEGFFTAPATRLRPMPREPFAEWQPRSRIEEIRRAPGLLGLLHDYQERTLSPDRKVKRVDSANPGAEDIPLPVLDEYVEELVPADDRPAIRLLPAGAREGPGWMDAYGRRVRSFDWEGFIKHHGGGLFYEWLRQELLERADVVMIDARTGLSEMGGVGTHQLADAVVLLCAANEQNVQGTVALAHILRGLSESRSRAHRPLDLLVVPSRIDMSMSIIGENVHKVLDEAVGKLLRVDYLERTQQRLMLPYQKDFSDHDALPILEPHNRLAEAYEAIGERLQQDFLQRWEILVLAAGEQADLREALGDLLQDYDDKLRCWWPRPEARPKDDLAFLVRRIRARARRSRTLILLLDQAAATDEIVAACWQEYLGFDLELFNRPRQIVVVSLDCTKLPVGWRQDARAAKIDGRKASVGDEGEVQKLAEAIQDELEITTEVGLVDYCRYLVRRTERITLPEIDARRPELDGEGVSLASLFVDRRLQVADGDVLPLEKLLQNHKRVTIIAGPGTGKSTLLHYLAHRLGRQRLHRDEGALEEFGFERPLLPILVYLPDAIETLHREQIRPERGRLRATDWLKILGNELRQGTAKLTEEQLQARFQRGELLLLLDALDEVADRDARSRLTESLKELTDTYPDLRCLLTSRRGTQRSVGSFMDSAELLPFQKQEIDKFVENWCTLLTRSESRALELADRIKQILEIEEIRQLATIPLLLTILAALQGARGKQQPSQIEIYRFCIDELIRRRRERLAHLGSEVEIRRYHVEMATKLVQAHVETRIADRAAPGRSLTMDLKTARNTLRLAAPSKVDPDSVLNDLITHAGLIHKQDAETNEATDGDASGPEGGGAGSQVGFRQERFLAYLVAEETSRSDNPSTQVLEGVLHPVWRRLHLAELTAGILLADKGPRELRPFLQRIADEPKRTTEERRAKAAGAVLARLHAFDPGHLGTALPETLGQVVELVQDPRQKMSSELRIATLCGFGDSPRDPRLRPEQRWCAVPLGPFWRGSNDLGAWVFERPMVQVTLDYSYRIARWPVTVGELARFVEHGYGELAYWSAGGRAWHEAMTGDERGERLQRWEQRAERFSNEPATHVTWWEAEAYCRWLTRELDRQGDALEPGHEVRLPTEDEWEKAARGGLILAGGDNPAPQRRYPWVGDFDAGFAHSCNQRKVEGVVPVGCFPAGNSPYGCWDMAGNVAEWCRDPFRPDRSVPSTARDDPDGGEAFAEFRRVARGGSWRNVESPRLQVSARQELLPKPDGRTAAAIGFRCVMAPRHQPD